MEQNTKKPEYAAQVLIPAYSKQDFLETTAPFEWLYGFHENRLQMIQLRNRLSEAAKAHGIRNFPAMFDEYITSMSKVGNSLKGEGTTDFDGQDKPLKCGTWEAKDSGITNQDRFGNDVQACPHPIYPSRLLTNIDTGLEKVELKWRRGNDPWKSHMFPKSTVSNASSIVRLADYGIAVTSENAKPLVRYLNDVESLNYDDLERSNSVGRLGWIEGYGFSPYIENLVFDGEDEYADRFKAVSEHGSYEKWLEAVKSIRKTESVYARIVIAASFASVLVKPTSSLPFLVHLWGLGGGGKTVCMMVAASIWANPEMGRFIKSFNSTGVGKELGSVFLNSLPLMLDELQIAATGRDKFRQMIYEFAEGVGRERGRKEGGLKKTGTWRNCMISTGEEPITDPSMTEGAKYRTLEIDCGDYRFFERGNIVGDAKKVANFFQNHYGFAGKIFVKNLQKDMEIASQLQEIHAKEILSIADVDQKQALSAALIITADELAESWIFNDHIALEAADVAPFLASKTESDQNKRALEFLYDQMSINAVHFSPEYAATANTQVWGEVKEWRGRKYLCVINSQLRVLLDGICNPEKFLKWARMKGLLRLGSDGKSTVKTRLTGQDGTSRCIWVCIPDESPEG